MAFIPEGEADSSLVRSAWLAMQRGPVPEGRLKSLSVPGLLSSKLSSRHEQATARQAHRCGGGSQGRNPMSANLYGRLTGLT